MPFLRKLNRPVYALLAVATIAGILRFWNLSSPPERVFDEIYYSKDACLYDGYTWKTCDIQSSGEKYWVRERDEVGSWVHPPMGKWMIAVGEKLFGSTPLGWRFSSALFGTATCVITAAIALLLFRSTLWAFVAGLLMATESLSFVMSRVSLLDVFLGFWVALGFLFLVLDRRWIHRRGNTGEEPPGPATSAGAETSSGGPGLAELPPEVPMVTTLPPAVPSPFWRPWRFAMGLALGAAAATKWSGLFALGGAFLLTWLWERTRRKKAGVQHPIWMSVRQETVGIIVALVLVPIAVYLLSYMRWWLQNGFHPGQFAELQEAMKQFHTTLDRLKTNGKLTHPYESRPWDWFVMARPVNFYFKGPGGEILAIGNPAIFWGSIVAIPVTAYSWWKKRDARGGFIVVAVLAQYLPWFLYVNRVQFFFYMTPIVPFMVLACVYSLRKLSDATKGKRGYSVVSILLVSASVGLFVYFWPVLTGYPLTSTLWKARIWFPGWF